jgi:hypothetical protein
MPEPLTSVDLQAITSYFVRRHLKIVNITHELIFAMFTFGKEKIYLHKDHCLLLFYISGSLSIRPNKNNAAIYEGIT